MSGPLPAMRKVWLEHRASVLEDVRVVEGAADALAAGALDEDLRERSERAAHKLAGTVGTFGYMAASERSRELERVFGSPGGPSPAIAPAVKQVLSDLRRELEEDDAEPSDAPGDQKAGSDDDSRLLLVVDRDPELARRLAAEAATHAIAVACADGPAEAREQIRRRRPDLVLLGLGDSANGSNELELLSELGHLPHPVPVLVMTASDAFTDRVEVARRGARGFVHRSLGVAELLAAAEQLLDRLSAEELKVLAVDDDPAVLEAIRAILGDEGLSVTGLAEPDQLWQTLDEVAPDLLILDLDMPGVSGTELCRVVRNEQRWAALPVIFLTAAGGSDTVQSVFAAGADDYLGKPIVAAELATRVRNRLERVRLYRTLAETDALTGVLNRRRSTETLELLVRAAERYGEPLSFAEIDIDRFKRVNDDHGHAVGDEVLRRLAQLLRRSFRGDDVVARWGGEEFVVGMYGMSREDGVQRVAEVLDAFRAESFGGDDEPLRLTFSAGVSQYPEDGTDLHALHRAADEALYSAKRAGRDRVLPAGWREEDSSRAVDVAVVEDDDAVAGVLAHALETRGYRLRRFVEGGPALAALGGSSPELGARLVLLDVNLPGVDGLSILRRLAHDGVLDRSRVIMLSARSGDEEVLQALELGAADHVAKPFSVPVLMQKVRRALADQAP